jgi:hypothetical protein
LTASPRAKIAGFAPRPQRAASSAHFTPKDSSIIMDAERINQIGSRIDDLRARTDALRGYL